MAAAALLLVGAAPDPDQVRRLQQMVGEMEAGRCGEAETMAAALLAEGRLPVSFNAPVGIVQMACLYDLGRQAEVAPAMLALSKKPGAGPLMEGWFFTAAEIGQFSDAAAALERGMAVDPVHMRQIDPTAMRSALATFYQSGQKDVRQRLVEGLGDIGFGGDDIEVRDNFMMEAVRGHLEAGRMADAERLARLMMSRYAMLGMLTDRAFQPLWPLLEESAGPAMARTNQAALEAARRHASAMGPAEESARAAQARRSLMTALWDNGDRTEALAEGARVLATPAELAEASQDEGWLLNDHAMLIARMGDPEAADARLLALTALDIAERPWTISMRINRGFMLDDHGMAETMLPMLDPLAADAATYGSAFARQLVRSLTICARARNGQTAQAQAAREELMSHRDVAEVATIEALMCLGETEMAADGLVRALENPEARSGAINALQPPGVTGEAGDRSLRPLLARPEVADAYRKVGRDLPEALRPAGIAR